MSTGVVRRKDKRMEQAEMEEMLLTSTIGHFATVDQAGQPYVMPNLFVYAAGKIYSHNTKATGHFRQNIEVNPAICFEVAEAGQIYPYGEFECDTTVSYRSVICFGQVSILSEPEEKQHFFDLFMAKYADAAWDRPKSFYPRLNQVTVYSLQISQMSGKKAPLPAVSERWPAANFTKTPQARPSSRSLE